MIYITCIYVFIFNKSKYSVLLLMRNPIMILKYLEILFVFHFGLSLLRISESNVKALSFHPNSVTATRNRRVIRHQQQHESSYRLYTSFYSQYSLFECKATVRSNLQNESLENNSQTSSRASYTRDIIYYTQTQDERSIHQALAILQQMETLNIPTDTYLYNLVLTAFAKLGNIKEATQLLIKMTDRGIANTVSYNICIHAYAKTKAIHDDPSSGDDGHSSHGTAAENLLLFLESNPTLRPDVITYTSTIDAIIRSKEPHAAERAEKILQRMFEISEKDTGNKSMEPNTITLNTVLHAWATSNEVNAPQRAEAILQKMEMLYESHHRIQPNTISYTTVIDTYAKSKIHDAALHAERIFKQMEKAYMNGNIQAKPNVQSFNTVLNAWALSRQPKGAARAETILKKMIALHLSGDFDVQPNVVSFTTVLSAWGKSGEPGSANRAEEIFNLMQQEYKKGNDLVKPNSYTYSVLIDAWLKSKEPGSVQHAQDIYDELVEAYRQGQTDVIPSTILATTIIDTWTHTGDVNAGDKAEAMLLKQQQLFNDYKDESMRVNSHCYGATINAIAKSRQIGKAEKARVLLYQMIDAYKAGDRSLRPTVHACTAVINACAYTLGEGNEKKKALDIASSVFKIMPEYAQPNEFTYGTFLMACKNLIPKGAARDSAMCTIFRHCCSNGQVGGKVIEVIEKSLSKEQVEKLTKVQVKDGTIKLSDLPTDWSRNVDKTKLTRKKD